MEADFLIYKRYVNKSVLWDGFVIEQDYRDMFLSQIGLLNRGEKRNVKVIFLGQIYDAEIKNLNNPKDKRKNDSYQFRYTANGAFARALQACFYRSWNYITEQRKILEADGDRRRMTVTIPEVYREYISFYTTAEENVFVCEPILMDEMTALREAVSGQTERIFEASFNFDVIDNTAGINEKKMLVRLRKLNRKIGDYLKEHYEYRCQICGKRICERYGSNLVEAHHIDYFVKSLNNDMKNQLIVCPNHHGIIHDRNPIYDREKKLYIYPNGLREGFILNDHL